MNTNKDYYINEKGLLVFTREFHLNRGFCCGNGCLHCPYRNTNPGGTENLEKY